jgi:single-strand DNA-binding protein
MYQKVVIVGNLGRDPEMRYTPSGQAVTNFSVATNRRWTNSDSSPGEETCWWRVTAWGKLAETCNQYLSKGRQVLVEGRMNPDQETGGPRLWVGQDGQARASFELTAITVQFLGGRDSMAPAADDEGLVEPAGMTEDEIPF